MGDAINRTTLAIVQSCDTPAYPDAPWMEIDRATSDTLKAVAAKYRVIDGDPEAARVMDQGEKDAVDAAETPPLAIDSLLGNPGCRDIRTVNYKSGLLGRLHKKLTSWFRGELREVEYYADDTETNLVLVVQVFADSDLTTPGYARDGSGLAQERWTKRTWKRTDGTDGTVKTTHKRYDHDKPTQQKEGRRRRQNVIDALELEVLPMLVATTAVNPASPTQAEIDAAEVIGVAYIKKYSDDISDYIRTGDLSFKTSPASPNITDDTETWLDDSVVAYGWTGPTIRDEMLGALKEIDEA